MLGGIQAGSSEISQLPGSFLLKAAKRPLESSSARMEPSFEHRRILSMVTRHLVAAATLPIAVTKVVHSLQRVLYPLRHTATEPELSTQIRTGLFEQLYWSALMQMRGPTNSRAESFLLSRFPSLSLTPVFIFFPHGTKNQNFPPMPPVPCPGERPEPPDASVKYSRVQAGKSVAGGGMDVTLSVTLSINHQK